MSRTHVKLGKNSIAGSGIRFDRLLLFTILGLSIFGAIEVFNASTVSAFRDFGNQYHFVKDHLIYLIIGYAGMAVAAAVDYHKWYKLSIPLLFTTLVLLIGVFIPHVGVHALGARRWINFGFFSLQPTEIAKLALVIYLSAWFAYKEKSRFVPFLVLLGIVFGLVILQPDLGTAVIILALAAILYFMSGAPLRHFLPLVPLVIIAVGVLAVVAPYRLDRITTFLHPNTDPLGSSYHIRQVLISFGSGGWFGVGLGKSRQKYAYLPEANSDSIFAIIAEEVGFLGASAVIVAFAFIIFRAYTIARYAPDRFGALLSAGMGAWFAVQTLINLGAMVVLIPMTGVPLPLVSSGGSNLISILVGFGIVLNISRQSKTHQIKN